MQLETCNTQTSEPQKPSAHLSRKVPGSDFGSLTLKVDSSFVILK